MNISLPTASPGSVPGERHPRQQFQRHGWCQCPRDKRGGITRAGGLDTTLTARECWFWCSRAKEGQDSLDLAAHYPQSPAVTWDGGRGVLSPAFRFQLGRSPWITGTPEPPRALQRPRLKGDNPKVSFPTHPKPVPRGWKRRGLILDTLGPQRSALAPSPLLSCSPSLQSHSCLESQLVKPAALYFYSVFLRREGGSRFAGVCLT